MPKDRQGNVLSAEVRMVDDVENSVILETNTGKMVVARGFDQMMVVDMPDVLLVCHRDDKTIKDIVTDLTVKDKIDRYL